MNIKLLVFVNFLGSCTLLTSLQGPDKCEISQCTGSDLALCESGLQVILAGGCSPGADLSGGDLSDADLAGADLSNANLTEANLTNADLSGADLTKARTGQLLGCPSLLPNSNFQCVSISATGRFAIVGPSVDLNNTNLTGAILRNVNLSDAILSVANLSNANLVGANLSDANFNNAGLTGARTGELLGCPSILPDSNFQCVSVSATGRFAIVGPSLNLAGIDLHDANLNDVDLTDTDLSNTNLFSADLSNTILNNTNLSSANLGLARLAGSTLNGANLSVADLFDADLSNADLSNVIGQPLNASQAIYSNTICPNGVNSSVAGSTCVGQGF